MSDPRPYQTVENPFPGGLRNALFSWAAYRTPPVRGQDRVHLAEATDDRVLTNLLSPEAADTGLDTEGGPSCPNVTYPSTPTSTSSATRRKIS